MVSLRWLGFVAAAVLPFVRADTPPNPGKWFNPHNDENATNYSVFHIGDRQNITFQVPWSSYNVMLWQQHPDNNGADRGPIVYTANGASPSYFEWDVALYNFNLTKTNFFFFWIFEGTDPSVQGNKSVNDSSSPYFKIAEAVTTAASSSTSTPTAAASTSSASTTASASSGGSLSAGASAGIGVGVALGVLAVAGIGGFLFWRKRRANKTSQQQQQASNGPWNEESKQYYTPVAGTPAYQDTSYHSASPPGPYNASQPTPVYEVAGGRDPVELGGN